MEEKLSEGEKAHPYAAETRVRSEIARVEKMSPESEKFFGPKGPKLEKLKSKLKAIKEYKRSGKVIKRESKEHTKFSDYINVPNRKENDPTNSEGAT